MERVLLDGSTVALSARMLSGRDHPSAVHLFDLAVVVESAILHDEVLVLSTERTPHADLVLGRKMFGLPLRIVRRSVEDIAAAAGAANGRQPGFGTTSAELFAASLRGDASASASGRSSPLGLLPHDDEFKRYLKAVCAVYRAPFWHRETPRDKALPERVRRGFGDLTGFREFVRTRATGRAVSLRDVWDAGPLHRASEPAMTTPHADAAFGAEVGWMASYGRLSARVATRIYLYLVAAEMFDAPYRADSLRWPLVVKYFDAGSPLDVHIDDRLIRMAEQRQRQRRSDLNDRLGRRAVVAAVPFFLEWILREAREPSDIPSLVRQFRASDEAERFRRQAALLHEDLRDGRWDSADRALRRYGEMLSRAVGATETEVILTLLAKGVAPVFGSVTPGAVLEAAGAAAKATDTLAYWRTRRRFALVSKPLKQVQRARDLRVEVKRLFGCTLSDDDVTLLDSLHEHGSAT